MYRANRGNDATALYAHLAAAFGVDPSSKADMRELHFMNIFDVYVDLSDVICDLLPLYFS